MRRALCRILHNAHLLRDLADVALVATKTAWAAGLAALLVEANSACDDARRRGLRQLAPARQRAFAARYDALVTQGLAANPEPAHSCKRDYYHCTARFSGCFRSQHGAERFAHLRSYLSTTRKHGVPAIDALTRLFEGDPWMPPAPPAI